MPSQLAIDEDSTIDPFEQRLLDLLLDYRTAKATPPALPVVLTENGNGNGVESKRRAKPGTNVLWTGKFVRCGIRKETGTESYELRIRGAGGKTSKYRSGKWIIGLDDKNGSIDLAQRIDEAILFVLEMAALNIHPA